EAPRAETLVEGLRQVCHRVGLGHAAEALCLGMQRGDVRRSRPRIRRCGRPAVRPLRVARRECLARLDVETRDQRLRRLRDAGILRGERARRFDVEARVALGGLYELSVRERLTGALE